ncbi:MAG: rRNA maturation RNase YbeY [Acidobacteriota bacterium]
MSDSTSDRSEPPSSSSQDDGPQRDVPPADAFRSDLSGTPPFGPRSAEPEIVLQVGDELGGESASDASSLAQRRLSVWLARLLASLAPDAGSLTVRLVGDDEMQGLNATWRGKDSTTDVLSFPGDVRHADAPVPDALGVDPAAVDRATLDPALFDGEPLHAGDIVVSLPVARRQAIDAGHDLARELRILLLHGVLHCLGYDHETDDGAMERFEHALRAQWLDDEPWEAAS